MFFSTSYTEVSKDQYDSGQCSPRCLPLFFQEAVKQGVATHVNTLSEEFVPPANN